jgi:hypothetical protein
MKQFHTHRPSDLQTPVLQRERRWGGSPMPFSPLAMMLHHGSGKRKSGSADLNSYG